MVLLWKGWALIALVGISGCASYHPMPITSEAVHASLQPPGMDELRILASQINHPILHPVELNPNEGLSPDGAAVIAVLLNPPLRAIRNQRAVSSVQILEAGLLPNPELTYSLDVPTGGNTTGRVTAYGLGLDWDMTSLISRASKVYEAKALKEAVDLDIAWQEWQVAQSAKNAVFQLFSLQNQVGLLEQVHKRMAENLVHVQKAVAEGSMTAADLKAAQTANSSANENRVDIEKQADQQRLQLGRLLGLPADTQIRLSKGIHLPSQVAMPTATALFEGLEQRRLDILALRRGYDSQEAAVRAAVLEQFPRISIGTTISRDTDNIRTTGFGLNIELPIFNRHQGKIVLERATRQKLFDEYVGRIFEARSDIEQVESGIHFLNEQIASAQAVETDLGRLEENYRAALADGRTDALIYYGVWKDFINAQTKVAALEAQLAQAVVALELASGFYEIPKPDQPPKTAPTEPKEEKNP
jgi:outer membrane protein, heavy metal efflux system